MSNSILKIHPADNVLVALTDLKAGEKVNYQGNAIVLVNDVPAKHKFVEKEFKPEDEIIMYGILVGKAIQPIPKGGVIGEHIISNTRPPRIPERQKHISGLLPTSQNTRIKLLWATIVAMVRWEPPITGS